MDYPWGQLHRSLFLKYFVALFLAVVVPLLAAGISNAWFGYRDQRTMLSALLKVEAASASGKIQSFLAGIRNQLGWTVQQPWTAGTEEQHRLDALRVLRQTPAVVSITLVDGAGIERLYVSRVELNKAAGQRDLSADPGVLAARERQIWYGPVAFYNGSEPFMTLAVGGNRQAVGIAIAELNLKLIWNLISAIRVGHTGHAFVLDQPGRLIAHPDISKVLRGADEETAASLRNLQGKILDSGGEIFSTKSDEGRAVVAAAATVPGVDWTVVVEQPTVEAFAPLYSAFWRTGALLLVGITLAVGLAYWLARRITRPIEVLEEGAEKIGAQQFDHRIEIATGDELERLATRFNQMARELAISHERSERIARLKRFLAPQVAELVEKAGDQSVLAGQRAEVVVVFCDLRGFTTFAAHAAPDEIMYVLGSYYEALGLIITRYEATLTSFVGDGLMVLVNAPVPRPEPALHAVKMAMEMQTAVQSLVSGWLLRGHAIGFGVGIAMGLATVGRIGSESRMDYTAIGNVVNLASRLCSSARDRQILIDSTVADAVRDDLFVVELGTRQLKGYDEEVNVFDAGNSGSVEHVMQTSVSASLSSTSTKVR
jgi:adenylate cyclase